MALTILMLASFVLMLSVARWLYLERRFARPDVPGREVVRVVGRLRGPGAVGVTSDGAPPFDLTLAGPVELEDVCGRRLMVLTDDAVLDMGWSPSRGVDLREGRLLTVDGEWTTVARDGLYREAGRAEALDAVRVVTGARPRPLRLALPVVLAVGATVTGLGLLDTLPSHMQATAATIQCLEGARRVSVTYTGDRGWAHSCVLPDGTLHGPWASYHRDGSPRRSADYLHGQLHGTERVWFFTGTLSQRTNYRRGKRHGLMKAWHPNGMLYTEGSYENGRRHGERRRLTSDGEPLELTSYDRGRRHGKTTWWRRDTSWFDSHRLLRVFPRGASMDLGEPMKVEYEARRGKPHGPLSVRFASGARGQGELHHGRKIGVWTLWCAGGKKREITQPSPFSDAMVHLDRPAGQAVLVEGWREVKP